MPIETTCVCGKAYRFKDQFAGRRAKCPACGHLIQIPPAPSTPVHKPDAPAPHAPSRHPAKTKKSALALAALIVWPAWCIVFFGSLVFVEEVLGWKKRTDEIWGGEFLVDLGKFGFISVGLFLTVLVYSWLTKRSGNHP